MWVVETDYRYTHTKTGKELEVHHVYGPYTKSMAQRERRRAIKETEEYWPAGTRHPDGVFTARVKEMLNGDAMNFRPWKPIPNEGQYAVNARDRDEFALYLQRLAYCPHAHIVTADKENSRLIGSDQAMQCALGATLA